MGPVYTRRRAAGIAFAAIVLLAGACGDATSEDGSVARSTTTAADPTTTDPTTTSAPPTTLVVEGSTTTEPPDPPRCAAPLAGRTTLPDPETGRVPVEVDLDGDGVADPVFFASDDAGDTWIQADRSTDGASTTAIRLDGIFGRETFLDAADLDGDGRNEAFLELAGNTFLTGVIVEIEDCELRAITTDDPSFDFGDGLFTYPVFSGGNGCAPTGCITSVVCTDRSGPTLEIVSAWPRVSALDEGFDADDPTPWADLPVEVRYDAFVIEDGRAVAAPPQGLGPPPVGVVEAGAIELAPWWELSGLHCDRLSVGDDDCDVFPELRESDEWKLTEQAFAPGKPVQYAALRRDDGSEFRVANPGPAAGAGREVIAWPIVEDDALPYCERWAAWSDDLTAEEFAEATRAILGDDLPA